MKKTMKIFIAAMAFIAVGLVILMVVLIGSGGKLLRGKAMKLTASKTISLDNIEEITIKYYSDDIKFLEGSSKEIVIKEYKSYTPKKKEVTEFTVSNNKISIKGYRKEWFLSFGFMHQRRVEIYLPEDYEGALSVATASGDIDGDIILKPSSFAAACSSGDISLNEIMSETINITTSSGDIKVEKAVGEFSASVTSGDVSLNEIISETINIKTSSGDIKVEKAEGELIASASSGEIKVNALSGQGSIDTSSGDITLQVTKMLGDIKLEASSGDVQLKLPTAASFDFEAKTTSGDIRTFFDNQLTFNKGRNHATGRYGESPEHQVKIKVSSGDVTVKQEQ